LKAHISTSLISVFATRSSPLSCDGRTVGLKSTPANVDALVAGDAATFRDEWRGRWVGVRLDRVTRPMLRDLLVHAWQLAAPKRLAATFRGRPGTPAA